MSYGCEKLGKSYGGRKVLADLTLSFSPGERICIAAPSGGGKTTLLRLLAGLERPDSGRVIGFDRAQLSMVFQEDRLFGQRSPVANVAMTQKGPDRAAIAAALKELLPAHCLDQPVRELSGGMRRRVAIVRAVLHRSDVLLLDEPFAGLDEENRAKAIRFIRDRQGDRLLLFTAHSPEEGGLLDMDRACCLPCLESD